MPPSPPSPPAPPGGQARSRRPGRSPAPIPPLLSRFPSILSPAAVLHHCRRCRLSPPPVGSSPGRSTRGNRSAVTFSSSPPKESSRGAQIELAVLFLPAAGEAAPSTITSPTGLPCPCRHRQRVSGEARVLSSSFPLPFFPPSLAADPPATTAVPLRQRARPGPRPDRPRGRGLSGCGPAIWAGPMAGASRVVARPIWPACTPAWPACQGRFSLFGNKTK